MALKGVRKLIAKIKNGPRALAHGDVHRGNLGLGDSGSIRLIDWSRCTVAPLPYNLVYLVERALARYPDYQLHQREFRQWAMSTYLAQLAKYKHKVSRKEFIRQYEITYLLHILVFVETIATHGGRFQVSPSKQPTTSWPSSRSGGKSMALSNERFFPPITVEHHAYGPALRLHPSTAHRLELSDVSSVRIVCGDRMVLVDVRQDERVSQSTVVLPMEA